MSALIMLAQAVVAVGALAAVAYPLLGRREPTGLVPSREDETEARRQTLLEQKRVVYEGIKELELDWTSGKLSEADYQALRRELEQEAVQVLKELDELEGKKESGPEEPGDATPLCPGCGRTLKPAHSFCPGCGTKIT